MKFVMTLIAAALVASPAVAALGGAALYKDKTCNAWPARTPPMPSNR